MRAVCAPKCLEKDAHADCLCLHCYPNAVGDNAWAYFFFLRSSSVAPRGQLHVGNVSGSPDARGRQFQVKVKKILAPLFVKSLTWQGFFQLSGDMVLYMLMIEFKW